jgi:hypothetical protein
VRRPLLKRLVRPKGDRRTTSAAYKKFKPPHFVPRSEEPERWSAGPFNSVCTALIALTSTRCICRELKEPGPPRLIVAAVVLLSAQWLKPKAPNQWGTLIVLPG